MDLYLYSIEFWKWQELSQYYCSEQKSFTSLHQISQLIPSPHHHPFCSALIFPHILNKPRFLYDRDSSTCHIQNILTNVFKRQDHSLLIYVNFRKLDSIGRGSDGAQPQIYPQKKEMRRQYKTRTASRSNKFNHTNLLASIPLTSFTILSEYISLNMDMTERRRGVRFKILCP